MNKISALNNPLEVDMPLDKLNHANFTCKCINVPEDKKEELIASHLY